MKQLYLIGLLLISPITKSQLLTDTQNLASEILNTLETTEAITTLVTNKKTVEGQLKDIRTWTLNEQLDGHTYNKMRSSYTSYAQQMNSIIDKLNEDLMSVGNTRQLKQFRLNRTLDKFNKRYTQDLRHAYQIYMNDFHPALQRAQQNANSKSGIIPTIILVVKLGESLITGIKNLFSKDSLNRQAKDDLIQTAMGLTLGQLSTSLRYPSWEDIVPAHPGSTASPLGSSAAFNSAQAISAKMADATVTQNTASVGLSYFQSDSPIGFHGQNKSINVGGQLSSGDSIFTVNNPLKNGDRFWVKLQGFQYASFFYYDDHSNSWQDPYGKSIVVGGSLNIQSDNSTYLPGTEAYFEIGGQSKMEHFLILVSKTQLSERLRSFLIGRNSLGQDLISTTRAKFPEIESLNLYDFNAEEQLVFKQSGSAEEIIPIYILIPKVTPNSLKP